MEPLCNLETHPCETHPLDLSLTQTHLSDKRVCKVNQITY
jgi:hypothetical protein